MSPLQPNRPASEPVSEKLSTGTKLMRLAVLGVVVLVSVGIVRRTISEIRSEHELKVSRVLAQQTSNTNSQRKIMVQRALDLNTSNADAIYDFASILVDEAKDRFRRGQSNLIDESGLLEAHQQLNNSETAFIYKPRVYRLRGEMALMLEAYYRSNGDPVLANTWRKSGYEDLVRAARQLPHPRQLRENFQSSIVLVAQAENEQAVAAEFIDKAQRDRERPVMLDQRMMEANSRTWLTLGLLPMQVNEFQYGLFEQPANQLWLHGLMIGAEDFDMFEVALETLEQAEKENVLNPVGKKLLESFREKKNAGTTIIEEVPASQEAQP